MTHIVGQFTGKIKPLDTLLQIFRDKLAFQKKLTVFKSRSVDIGLLQFLLELCRGLERLDILRILLQVSVSPVKNYSSIKIVLIRRKLSTWDCFIYLLSPIINMCKLLVCLNVPFVGGFR